MHVAVFVNLGRNLFSGVLTKPGINARWEGGGINIFLNDMSLCSYNLVMHVIDSSF
jgi:hypothetical protein